MGHWQRISSNVSSKAANKMMGEFLEQTTGAAVRQSVNPMIVAGAIAGGALLGNAITDNSAGAVIGGGAAGAVAYNIARRGL